MLGYAFVTTFCWRERRIPACTAKRLDRYRDWKDYMAFIPVPNGIQLCFLFNAAAQKWQFCLTLRKSAGAPTSTDLDDVALIGENWWSSNAKIMLTADNTLSEVTATDLTSQGAPQSRSLVGIAGTASGTSAPLNVALVVSHRTEKRGRSYRGRTYLSGIPEPQIENVNLAKAAYAADVVSRFGDLQTTLDGAGYDLVVASKRHNGVVTNPAETNEVIALVADTLLDSQRRRLTGRGT